MIFHKTSLQDAYLIELEKKGDDRGFFARTMCREEFAAHGLDTDYVQQNTSFSAHKGTLRGMHYQLPPYTEAKLVRCIAGAIVDVIVDLRRQSPTFMKHERFELNDRNRLQLYVPRGFAHAFQTVSDDAEVSYLVSAPYTPSAERGVRYSDPRLGITWPLPVTVISNKDASWPLLQEGAGAPF
ncbi:dTDP-4-dehydrorhamnose 3,5-epimerase [Dongia deserti]|uniref:dTDP-4-dehydrorhamnose 3,5-epimerase n=1 Tax=Dongia deserti TaxID=2268030 RepID=UPI000E648679|nr:dTDP-4-dehydrorhamnose 3,5-epimerase [Dongia deserti]